MKGHAPRQKRIRELLVVLAVLAAIVASVLLFRERELPRPVDPLYLKRDAAPEERIEDLLSHMTLEEKVGQMALVEKNSITDLEDIKDYGIGAILSGAGAKPEENTPSGWIRMVEEFSTASQDSRLRIPILYGVDANHGHSNVPGATIFPHFIALGATGDTALVEDVARATGEELSATGIYWSYSPTLDLPEDIRWGRVYEAFSDDPALAGRLGAAYVRGLQEVEGASLISVLATPKHYIGGGAMLWNSSTNADFRIDQGTTPPDEEKLRSTYLPPFREAIDAGAMSIMVGLNSWGDTKLSAERHLVTDVLKEELGFEGFVVSDWYGVYEIPGGTYKATVSAINAGVDMVMLPFEYETFTDDVLSAVRRGDIEEARIDDAVRRILRAKFALGLFERESAEDGALGSDEHRAVARRAVSESLVLLKNENSILPIREGSHIRIAGSAADNVGMQSGAWTVEWQGIDGNWLSGGTSILEGIREVAGEDVTIEYDESGNFPEDREADIGIAIVGESPYAEGWGDRANPTLSTDDLAVIERLRNSSGRLVVVLVTGRPLMVADELPAWDALAVAWLPGSEGGGVADVLLGRKGFTGSLPLPWPASVGQLPIETDGSTRDGSALLFPRYFGLRY